MARMYPEFGLTYQTANAPPDRADPPDRQRGARRSSSGAGGSRCRAMMHGGAACASVPDVGTLLAGVVLERNVQPRAVRGHLTVLYCHVEPHDVTIEDGKVT